MAKTLELKPLSHAECTGRLNAIGDALYVIGGKWKLRIVVALAEGYKRFNEIQRVLNGISAKVLASELKEMELNGLVKRNVIPSTPVVIEYELTEYSDTLSEVLRTLSDWGLQHRDKIRNER
jgi:DNA-binding HxlR family transcriptional regulator